MKHEAALTWATAHLGSAVVEASELTGGWTSTMLGLTTERGEHAVLRLMTKEPWRTHGAGLTAREHWTQLLLAGTDLPAPRTIALDAEGVETDHPAHLMSRVPGAIDFDRVDAADLDALAQTLAKIHDLRPGERPREYQSWAVPAKFVVPAWTREPAAWERAFAILEQVPPAYDGTFLHRDFGPRNVLWTGGAITGVVDWVETSWGPAWLDVAHCRSILAFKHGTAVAARFGRVYVGLTGRAPAPYFDVMDVVGLLPHPERAPFLSDPAEQRRLEEHLLAVLATL